MTHALSVELTDSMQGAIALTMTEPQSEHLASIDWQRGKWADVKGKYSREHTSWLVGGAKIKASDAYFLLPEVYRDGAKVDPEKMFVATIASAHMLLWRRRPRELAPPASARAARRPTIAHQCQTRPQARSRMGAWRAAQVASVASSMPASSLQPAATPRWPAPAPAVVVATATRSRPADRFPGKSRQAICRSSRTSVPNQLVPRRST